MKNYTEIAVILDRSGSMSVIADDTIGGFNTFIEDQKKVQNETRISIYRFDDQFDSICEDADLQACPRLDNTNFVPRGWTALYDAIGRTVTALGSKLASKSESERPNKVIVLIMTDGFENKSTEFDAATIKKIITEQTEKFNWQFIFIGSNQDAVLTGAHLGINQAQAMTFDNSSQGVGRAYMSLSSNVANFRSGVAANTSFSLEDRKAQDDLLNQPKPNQ